MYIYNVKQYIHVYTHVYICIGYLLLCTVKARETFVYFLHQSIYDLNMCVYTCTCTCILGCVVLLCLVCLFDLACFFLSSFSSLIKNMYTCTCMYTYHYHVYMYMYTCTCIHVCMHIYTLTNSDSNSLGLYRASLCVGGLTVVLTTVLLLYTLQHQCTRCVGRLAVYAIVEPCSVREEGGREGGNQ